MSGDVAAKARFLYCIKCKDYVEISRFKEELGASSKGGVCDRHPEETTDVVRFCSECQEHLPIAEFPKGQKRFVCKTHWAMRKTAKSREDRANVPGRIFAERTWSRCWRDGRRFVGTKMDLTVNDILQIWQEADPVAQQNLILLPIDPSVNMNKDNAVIVDKKKRSSLLKSLSKNGIEKYKRIVQLLLKKAKNVS